MRKWFAFLSIITAVTIIIGQMGKSTFKDCGISDMAQIDQLETLHSNIDYLLTEEDNSSFIKYKDDYVKDVDSAECIFIVKATGKITQSYFDLSQEVIVEDVIKGAQETKGRTIYIHGNYGFNIAQDLHPELTYYSIKNIMNTTDRYLVFLNHIPIKNYREGDYLLVDSLFDYLNLNYSDDHIIKNPVEEITYQDMREFEFFCNSKDTLASVLKIKSIIINKYS